MSNIYQSGLDGALRVQWKIDKIVPEGDMSGDGRLDVSPDGKRLLLSIDTGEESGRKNWDGAGAGALDVRCAIKKGDQAYAQQITWVERRLAR